MSTLFLLNEAISVKQFNNFKQGMMELNAIKRHAGHSFKKHASVYSLDNYALLFSNNYGQEEQVIAKFIEQLSPTETYIDTEKLAHEFCGGPCNAFMGIDFSTTSITRQKRILNNDTYQSWSYDNLSEIEKLKQTVGKHEFSSRFERDFERLSVPVQIAIIEELKKAKERNLLSPFYPDTKIIKEVTPSNGKCNVLELRLYTPQALRMYFHEKPGMVYLASIEAKSNPNQSADINAAHKILKDMLHIK